jgi:hypothetical protein
VSSDWNFARPIGSIFELKVTISNSSFQGFGSDYPGPINWMPSSAVSLTDCSALSRGEDFLLGTLDRAEFCGGSLLRTQCCARKAKVSSYSHSLSR